MKNTYERIVEDIEKDIKNGCHKAGKKLPSVRELGNKYNCSKNTVVKAYETLKNNHIVYSIPQSGYYIVEKLIKNEETTSSVINFSTGNPIIGNMNTPDLKHCLDRAVDIYRNNSLSSNSWGGVGSLRRILPKYLSDFQVFTNHDNIFVNLGIQQALSILTQMPFPNDKNLILIEQPTYRFFMEFLKFYGAKVIGITRDENGIDLNRLEDIFKKKRIKFFYTIPRNHNPLGTSYNRLQRKAIAELAAKYDVYIVEDDYFGDISFDSRYDPIYAYSDNYHHIYLKSFSKIIPWMRIGFLVVPSHLLNIFQQFIQLSYYYSYFSPSLVSQATLEIYIRSNILRKHVTSIKKELSEKQKVLRKNLCTLEEYDIKCIGGKSGFYSCLQLPHYINENKLVQDLKKQNVFVFPGARFYLDDSFYKKSIRLSIACVNRNDIDRGFEIIKFQLEKYSKGYIY
ncbi:PLP-dependent aminotransferase family protein [Clostridium sp. D2Q-14]|uniref:aminotransferase-like domain-containing protein n=1 Tax=Anaeromonas gelatinilytica TaxID=2683194 RepID=UPI00193B5EBE|nr:PLP-dependent aminotransferase family protein [Anaeromonas gelatinilytica]MBS4535924.1 PLP-dependent aminotransferase family protein [Anaeromonas gelatinilytica]